MDITPILNSAITLLAGIISIIIIPWIKSKVDAETLNKVKYWVDIAVKAAEQLYKESGLGEKKKEYVKSFLESKGLKVDMETLDSIIESSVFELNNTK